MSEGAGKGSFTSVWRRIHQLSIRTVALRQTLDLDDLYYVCKVHFTQKVFGEDKQKFGFSSADFKK